MVAPVAKALNRAQDSEGSGYRYSYDMLGEAAHTDADAPRYMKAYAGAIDAIGKAAAERGPIQSSGTSVKLSALHPRYKSTQGERVMAELVPRFSDLALQA